MSFFTTVIRLIFITLLAFSTSVFAVDAPTSDNIEVVNSSQIDEQGSNAENSTLVNSLCTIILIMNGRVARLIAAIAIFGLGVYMWLGNIKWPIIISVPIGCGIVFGAKTVALAILPRAVQTYNHRQKEIETKTTSELITQACPELL